MNLYIETDNNGNPINHPAFEDNLLDAFGSIPDHWEAFTRVERPVPAVYQVLDSQEPTYEKNNGVWTDVWTVRDMTAEEKTTKQQAEKDNWSALPNRDNFTAWTFDESTCRYVPPTPRPTDGNSYFWQGTTNSWVILLPYPDDGKQYKLDIPTATWVLITA
jgi:hypothetical protein